MDPQGATYFVKWFTHYFKRYSVIFVSNIIIVLMAFWQFTSGEALTAFILMWGLPISRIFMVGKLKSRLVNGLTFIVIYVYLLLGVRFGWWDQASYLLLATPYISIVLKPKRSWIKYLTVGLTTVYLIYGLISGNQVPWFIKVPSIGLVYIIFFPSIVKSTFKKQLERFKRKELTSHYDQ